jgi:hypothetical protein
MTTRRFVVTPVSEHNRDQQLSQPSELIPLINIENDIPFPPPLPPPFTLVNEINKPSTRLFNSFLHRLKPNSSSVDIIAQDELPIPHLGGETDELDPDYLTTHSNTFDTNSLRLTNKFLHELRLKRREFHDKAKNLSIDQRIALYRRQADRDLIRAQDIFDVHFESNDNDNIQDDFFNEDLQEKIRSNIFHELDRQRIKQYHKQHRQLVLGRALLMFITSLLAFMSITLVYVVLDLYSRAKNLDTKLSDNEFMPMINDKTTDI